MKAVVCDAYGPPEVLRIEEIERPVPAEGEVLVRVHASTVNQTDAHFRRATNPLVRLVVGVRRPRQRIVGSEFAGVVEAAGGAVTDLKVGDRVFGVRQGANAEYVCVRASRVVARIPAGMTFKDAAAIPDGAFQGLAHLRKAKVGPGTRLVVYGASGSCGTAAVQLARSLGAHVTAVCSTPNVDLVRSLGADEVIDYTRDDFTKNGQTYDVILDAVGKHSYRRCRGSLKPGGLFVPTDGLENAFWVLVTRFGSRKVVMSIPQPAKRDILFIKERIEAGEYRAVVDRTYPLEQVVEAHRYVGSWRKRGNVVLSIVE